MNDWSHDEIGSASTAPAGSHTAGSLTMAGGSTDGTSDTIYFRNIDVKEWSDVRVNLAQAPASGLAGGMIRDSNEPDSPFALAAKDAQGNLVLRYRRSQGQPSRTISLGPNPSLDWIRLSVGRSAVYVFGATHDYPTSSGSQVWTYLACIEVDLRGDDDRGGAFVEDGTATIPNLVKTDPVLWSEKEQTAIEVPQTKIQGSWSRIGDPEAIGGERLSHPAGTGGVAEFSLGIKATGTYRVLVHCPDDATGTIDAEVGGYIYELPPAADTGEWREVAELPATAGQNLSVKIHSRSDGPAIVDSVRAIYEEPGAWQNVGWNAQGANRIDYLTNWSVNSGLKKVKANANDTNYNDWNGGGWANYRFYKDFCFQFQVPVNDLTLVVGASTVAGDASHESITHRFTFTGGDERATASGGGSSASQTYNSGTWFTIERVGGHLQFRRDGIVIHQAASPVDQALYLDSSLKSLNARFFNSRTKGWRIISGSPSDLDADGHLDSLEQLVIDADPEDQVQSFWDVVMTEDLDQDGISNLDEVQPPAGRPATNPVKADTDGDGLSDKDEFDIHGTNPTLRDTDDDGLDDGFEVSLPYGFDPTKKFTIDDGVSDYTRWEILAFDPNDGFDDLNDVLPDDDFDGDNVSNRHESEDATSAVDIDDYFRPVVFDRLFGKALAVDVHLDLIEAGVEATRLVRPVPETPENPLPPAGGISHHEARDGTRLRFQITELPTTTTADQVVVGFSHRGHPPYDPFPEAHYAVAIRIDPIGIARITQYGSELSAVPPFLVRSTDLIELRLETGEEGAAPRFLHVEVNHAAIQGSPILLPEGTAAYDSFLWDPDKNPATPEVLAPLAAVVRLGAYGSGVKNLRYRRVTDPDRDDDGMPDVWEQQIMDAFPQYPTVPAVLPEGRPDADDLTNLEEYELGTDPTKADTDGDGMRDDWEHAFGLDPTDAADGTPTADLDGDGLSNRAEFDFGSRPDRISTAEDGFSDQWKHRWGLDPNVALDPEGDEDNDGLDNAAEFAAGTNPGDEDSAGDGFSDGWKQEHGISPLTILLTEEDFDGDGLNNALERDLGTHPNNTDTDSDGMLDGWEYAFGAGYVPPAGSNFEPVDGLNPLNDADALEDPDGDNFNNLEEFLAGTDPHDFGSNPNTIDSDGDGMVDWWEIQFGLNPADGSDSAYDWDYDGLTNLQEYEYHAGHGVLLDPTPRWRNVPIPGGLPAWSTTTVADNSLASPMIGGFNALGQLVRFETESGGMKVRRFDPFLQTTEFDGWSDETDDLGAVEDGVTWHAQEVRQNFFGLVAATFRAVVDGQPRMQLRILGDDRRPYLLGDEEPAWSSISGLRITDSGYVVASVLTADSTKYLLRWRQGSVELHPLSVTPAIGGLSERGEVLVNGLGRLKLGEATTWLAPPTSASAIRPYGGLDQGVGLADNAGYLNYLGGSETVAFYRSNQRGDWIGSPSHPLWGNPEAGGRGKITLFGGPGWSSAQYLWETTLRNTSEYEVPGYPSSPPDWMTFGSDLNRRGDFVAGFVANLDEYRLGDDPYGTVPFEAWGSGVLIQRGRPGFSRPPSPFTRYWRIADSGAILASSASSNEIIDPGTGTPTGQYQVDKTWFVILPDNDSDRDGMPDDWELYHYGEGGAPAAFRDQDHDGIDTRQEAVAGSDPDERASRDDGIDDGWKVRNGLDPAANATGDSADPDGDGLGWSEEFNGGWDPHSPDSDRDGTPDAGDPVDDREVADFGTNGLRVHLDNSSDFIFKNGFGYIHNGVEQIFQSRTLTLVSGGRVEKTEPREPDNPEAGTRKTTHDWNVDSEVSSNYDTAITSFDEGEQIPEHIRSAFAEIETEIITENDLLKETSTYTGSGHSFNAASGDLITQVDAEFSAHIHIHDKVEMTDEEIDFPFDDPIWIGEPETGILEPYTIQTIQLDTADKFVYERRFDGSNGWSNLRGGETKEVYRETYSERIPDISLAEAAYAHTAGAFKGRRTATLSEGPLEGGYGFSLEGLSSALAARMVAFDRYNDFSDTRSAYVEDGSYRLEVDDPKGQVFEWSEPYRLVTPDGDEVEVGVVERRWVATEQFSPLYKLGNPPKPDGVTCRVHAHYLGSMVGELGVTLSWKEVNDDYPRLEPNVNPFTDETEGQRIFPGKKDPNDQIRNKVILRADVGAPDVMVYVKAFDVDDPTPVDEDIGFEIDSNDASGAGVGYDNRVNAQNRPLSGKFTMSGTDTANKKTNAEGFVEFEFEVGMQPGNNYRVVASLHDRSDYDSVQVINPQDEENYLGPSDSPTEIATSPLLTVWRKLHIENDSMDAIPASRPAPDHVGNLEITTVNPTTGEIMIDHPGDMSDEPGFYTNGYIAKSGSSPARIIDYSYAGLFDKEATITVALPNIGNFSPGDIVSVFDDDDLKLPAGYVDPPIGDEMHPRLKLPKLDLVSEKVKAHFRTSYIEVLDVSELGLNLNTTIPFRANEHPSIWFGTILDDSKDVADSDSAEFWVYLLVTAYQPSAERDGDIPSGSGLDYGFTVPALSEERAILSVVYLETIREEYSGGAVIPVLDYQRYIDSNVAHEIGHAPSQPPVSGITDDHLELELMTGPPPLGETKFSSKSIARFRSAQNGWTR